MFQATIECGLFGDGDPNLCMLSEYTIGDIVMDCDEEEVLAEIFFPLADGNGFVKVNDKLPVDGSIIDKDTICVFPGMFRASSAMDGNMMRPILLATSNGCSIDTKNFKEVTRTKKYVPIYTLDKKYWSHSGLVNFLYLCKSDVTVTRLPGGHSSLENCSGAKYKIFT